MIRLHLRRRQEARPIEPSRKVNPWRAELETAKGDTVGDLRRSGGRGGGDYSQQDGGGVLCSRAGAAGGGWAVAGDVLPGGYHHFINLCNPLFCLVTLVFSIVSLFYLVYLLKQPADTSRLGARKLQNRYAYP